MLVKKYGNRRLYDTEESRYITLEELAGKLRSGRDVRVVDAKNGQDLTQVTLTQIIIESRYVRLDEIAKRIRDGADVQVVDARTGADLTAPVLAQIIFEDRNAARLLPVPLLLQLIRMGDGPLAEFLGRYVSWALEMYLQARSGLGTLYNPYAALRPYPAPGPQERLGVPEPTPAGPRDEVAELRRELAALRRSLKRKPSRRR
jgi:polyhydroxyalkanoate synthesis repressor PhaR